MTALKTLLENPNQPISMVVELTYRDPDTDAEATLQVADKNWEGDEAGVLKLLLLDPGSRAVSVEADELGGISRESLGSIVLDNAPTSPGGARPFDEYRGKTFSGRSVRVLAGSPTEPLANYEPVGTSVAAGEPEFDDWANLVRITQKSALEMLSQDLDVRSYVGEPSALRHLTTTGSAAAADNAAHHLAEFTVAGRFRHDGAPASSPSLSRRHISNTSSNWQLFLSGGQPVARYSSGGVAQGINLIGADALDDGAMHWWVLARRSGHVYLMVDGAIVAETETAPDPDQPTSGVTWGQQMQEGPGETLDHRILNHYIAPDEARAWMAVRSPGTEQGLVGLWRGDDNVGNTLTDHSPTGADATISGVEDTDFAWVSSDLGGAELAGQSMPALMGGVPGGAPTDLVDPFRERHRASDIDPPYGLDIDTVRDEGDLLTVTTDYVIEDSVIVALNAEAGEPVTVTTNPGTGDQVTQILRELVVDRGPLEVAGIETFPLQSIYANYAGLSTRRQPVSAVMGGILPGMLAHAATRRDGSLRFDCLLPPVAPSPRDGRCLEMMGETTGGVSDEPASVTWASVDPLGASRDFTLAAWVKIHRLGPSASGLGGFVIMDLSGGSAPFGPGLELYLDLAFGVPRMILKQYGGGSEEREAGYGEAFDFGWHFLAVAHDDAAGTCKFYAGRPGATLRLIGTTADFALWGEGSFSDGVRVGSGYVRPRFRGSCFEPSAWSTVRTLAQLQSQMNDGLVGTEVGLGFFAPIDGSSAASRTDAVSSAVGAVAGEVVERPDLEVDLVVTPRPFHERLLVPARRIEVQYRRNYAVLDEGQIADVVDQETARDLKSESRSETWESPSVAADYQDARDITILSPWAGQDGALATLRLARYRYAPGRRFALLERAPKANREAILLEVGDEVRVRGHQDLASGPVYRVASNQGALAALEADLGLLL